MPAMSPTHGKQHATRSTSQEKREKAHLGGWLARKVSNKRSGKQASHQNRGCEAYTKHKVTSGAIEVDRGKAF